MKGDLKLKARETVPSNRIFPQPSLQKKDGSQDSDSADTSRKEAADAQQRHYPFHLRQLLLCYRGDPFGTDGNLGHTNRAAWG